MAETYVSRPHFEELTLDCDKVHVLLCGFQNVLFFANKLGHTRVYLTAVWSPHS